MKKLCIPVNFMQADFFFKNCTSKEFFLASDLLEDLCYLFSEKMFDITINIKSYLKARTRLKQYRQIFVVLI